MLEEDRMGRPLWCGGDTVVVQLGDVLDRGDCEIGALPLCKFMVLPVPLQAGGRPRLAEHCSRGTPVHMFMLRKRGEMTYECMGLLGRKLFNK